MAGFRGFLDKLVNRHDSRRVTNFSENHQKSAAFRHYMSAADADYAQNCSHRLLHGFIGQPGRGAIYPTALLLSRISPIGQPPRLADGG